MSLVLINDESIRVVNTLFVRISIVLFLWSFVFFIKIINKPLKMRDHNKAYLGRSNDI